MKIFLGIVRNSWSTGDNNRGEIYIQHNSQMQQLELTSLGKTAEIWVRGIVYQTKKTINAFARRESSYVFGLNSMLNEMTFYEKKNDAKKARESFMSSFLLHNFF